MGIKPSRILVTGGAGFIGSHIVDRLINEGCDVKVLDNLFTGSMSNINHLKNNKKLTFIKGDIADYSTVKKAVKNIDAIFHQAALVSVVRSVKDPILVNNTNILGTLNILKTSLDSSVKRIVYASSSSVYGDTKKLPKDENLSTKPVSPYAVSKLAGEDYCRVFYKVYGIETISLRYFNVYGPRQTAGPYSGVIPIFINRIMNSKSPEIFGDGEQTRDFTYVKDVVEANIRALKITKATGDYLNIATGKTTSINELAQTLQDIMGKTRIKPIHVDDRPGDIRHSYADLKKAHKTLNYIPKIELKRGLRELVEWYNKCK